MDTSACHFGEQTRLQCLGEGSHWTSSVLYNTVHHLQLINPHWLGSQCASICDQWEQRRNKLEFLRVSAVHSGNIRTWIFMVWFFFSFFFLL